MKRRGNPRRSSNKIWAAQLGFGADRRKRLSDKPGRNVLREQTPGMMAN